MKKNYLAVFIFVAIVLALITLLPANTQPQNELIRIHIRADSNATAAQNIKYAVRDSVIEYLTPYLAECQTRAGAYTVLTVREDGIKRAADKVLSDAGLGYRATVSVLNEYFPTRVYGDITVESGYYDALIIELGSGSGDNWWCVIYPPLCFLEAQGEGDFRYKSKIKELIDKYFGK